MLVAVIDGMGGGLGAQLAAQLSAQLKDRDKVEIIVLGTNAVATNHMIKAANVRGATGENAVQVSIARADIVVGPLGIALPNALMGEITPAIAAAVVMCRAHKILIPVSHTDVEIVGLEGRPLVSLIKEAVSRVCEYVEKRSSL